MKSSCVADYYCSTNTKYHNIHTGTNLASHNPKLPRSFTTSPKIRDGDNLRPESPDE